MIKGILFSLAACGLWLMINVRNIQAFIDARQHRDQEVEQIELTKKRIERLKRQQTSLANNGLETERQARIELGMQLPGEKVILLKREDADAASVGSASLKLRDDATTIAPPHKIAKDMKAGAPTPRRIASAATQIDDPAPEPRAHISRPSTHEEEAPAPSNPDAPSRRLSDSTASGKSSREKPDRVKKGSEAQ